MPDSAHGDSGKTGQVYWQSYLVWYFYVTHSYRFLEILLDSWKIC